MKNFYLTFTLFFLTIEFSFGQEYSFTSFNQVYEELDNPIVLNENEVWEYPDYEIPIGFDFSILNLTSDKIYFIEDGLAGYISLSPNINSNIPMLVPIGQDIKDRGNNSTGSLSPISYKLVGEDGNRILKMEWKNVGFFGDQTGNDYINFQVWLYENNNIIEYHYGDSDINNPISYDYESGPSVLLFPLVDLVNEDFIEDGYILNGLPNSPTLSIVNNDNPPSVLHLDGDIPSGTTYRFTPSNDMNVKEKEKENFMVYPNPATNIIYIKNSKNSYDATSFIYDHLGRLIMTSKNEKLDISILSKGIYYIQVKNDSESITNLKFIKS